MRYRSIIAFFLALSWLCGTVPAAGTVSVTRNVPFFSSAGPNSTGTVSSIVSGGTPWSSPSNATASDDVRTTSSPPDGITNADFLKATNFGFSITSGASINGITLEIEGYSSNAANFWTSVVLFKTDPNTDASSSKSAATPTSESYVTIGSASDVWGTTWTTSQINASTFGVRFLGANNSGAATNFFIDHIRITVTYSVPSGGGFFRLIGFSDPYDRPRSIRSEGEK